MTGEPAGEVRSAGPEWPRTTSAIAKRIAEDFRTAIKEIAIACARHESAEYVLKRHVDEAFITLGRLHFNRRPWYKRPELEVGFGTFLAGLAASLPDITSGLVPDMQDGGRWIVRALMIGMMPVAGGLAVHGWLRGRT